ncbi:MAG: hypothetical protein KAT70_06650, partial [Thermoplasmata archaeon]|nr:hypothetical protein [Thermoplasmata archaeon]
GIDVQTELLIIVSELKKYAMSSLPISATEIQQLEKKIRQLQVIDTLFGTLSDIPSKEIEAFDEAIERRDFFG